MACLYETKQREEILRSLRIKPIKGKVTGEEAARILSWRAREEQGVEHKYTSSILRRHVEQGNLEAYPGTRLTDKGKSRKNLYDVEAVFELSIAPRRGVARKQKEKSVA